MVIFIPCERGNRLRLLKMNYILKHCPLWLWDKNSYGNIRRSIMRHVFTRRRLVRWMNKKLFTASAYLQHIDQSVVWFLTPPFFFLNVPYIRRVQSPLIYLQYKHMSMKIHSPYIQKLKLRILYSSMGWWETISVKRKERNTRS